MKNLNLAKEHSIVIGLTSFHRAAVLEKQHEGKIIPSNFVSIEFQNGIMDPYYFAWYFNEHPEIKRQRMIAIQGNSSVKVLSVHMIRQLMIECPNLSTQMSIGKAVLLSEAEKSTSYGKDAFRRGSSDRRNDAPFRKIIKGETDGRKTVTI